jgi:AraC-like DNA-binding protein
MADRRDELCDLITRHAREHGRTATSLPGLRFNRADRPSVFSSNKVPALALALIVQGAKVCRIGAREYHYDTDTYLVFAGETQFTSSVLEASRERPYLSISLQLPSEEIVRTLLSLGDRGSSDPGDREAPAFSARVEPPLVDALCRLVATLDDPAERQVIAPLVLSELVFRLLRSEAASMIRYAAGQHGDQARIGQAMTFMRAHLARRLSVAAIARHVAMSPSHFAHRFREVARTSPMLYLKHVRLQAARVSLLEGGSSPAEVAARVGYQSAAHFSRDFKSYFALPPAAYVRQFRDRAARAPAPADRSQDPATRSQGSVSSPAPA